MTVRDLTKTVPRSPYEELGGYPWLARLIDKVRALAAGKLGEYTSFPCGGDQIFLGAVEVHAASLKAQIDHGATDDEIVAWLKANGAPGHMENMGGLVAQLHAPIEDGPQIEMLNTAKRALAKARPDLDVSGAANFIHLICLEEGHMVPGGGCNER